MTSMRPSGRARSATSLQGKAGGRSSTTRTRTWPRWPRGSSISSRGRARYSTRTRESCATRSHRCTSRGAELLPFEELPVHFARFFLLDEAHDLKGAVIPAALVFLSDVDAPLHQYLSRLAARAGPGLDQIFSHCEGYPQGPDVIPQERVRYLQARMVRSATVYVNT